MDIITQLKKQFVEFMTSLIKRSVFISSKRYRSHVYDLLYIFLSSFCFCDENSLSKSFFTDGLGMFGCELMNSQIINLYNFRGYRMKTTLTLWMKLRVPFLYFLCSKWTLSWLICTVSSTYSQKKIVDLLKNEWLNSFLVYITNFKQLQFSSIVSLSYGWTKLVYIS